MPKLPHKQASLNPGKYLLNYERRLGKPGDIRIKCEELIIDLSKPGKYELEFTPKLGTAEIAGTLDDSYAVNFEKVGDGPWIGGCAYIYPNRQYSVDGLPDGKYRLGAISQDKTGNVFVSQAEVTVSTKEKATVNMATHPRGNCSLKGSILGEQKKYQAP